MHDLRPAASGLEFIDHRDFIAGDDPRGIDWRASARRRQPLVRRYRDERASDWLILLDRSASMDASAGVWSLAVQLAAGLAFVPMQLGHRTLVALFSDRLDAWSSIGRSETAYLAQRRLLATAMARQCGGASRPEAALPLTERGSRVLLISDGLRQDAMVPALARLRSAAGGLEMIQVQGPLPELDGPVTAVDIENGSERVLMGDTATRAEAVKARTELDAALTEGCRRLRVPLSRARPGDDWDRVLLRHLLRHPRPAVGNGDVSLAQERARAVQ
ncbi:DUF58 domain-containing protein [Halochromatium glycolicum]|uniref:DUF58 domain-containing protein n=1 Tax=Halochromatium glycolicum TaxID=85075 RepID=UPI00190A2DCF|nr:DUF58 domain-containing protein [Halochromatium glycolicum]